MAENKQADYIYKLEDNSVVRVLDSDKQSFEKENPSAKVYIKSPDGRRGTIPFANVDEYERRHGTGMRLSSLDFGGDEEIGLYSPKAQQQEKDYGPNAVSRYEQMPDEPFGGPVSPQNGKAYKKPDTDSDSSQVSGITDADISAYERVLKERIKNTGTRQSSLSGSPAIYPMNYTKEDVDSYNKVQKASEDFDKSFYRDKNIRGVYDKLSKDTADQSERLMREYEYRRNNESDTDKFYYKDAARLYKQASLVLGAPSKYGDENGLKNYAKGIGDEFKSGDDFFGISGLFRDLKVHNILKKIEKYDEQHGVEKDADVSSILSDGELELLSAWRTAAQAISSRRDLSMMYNAGKGFAESLPYMVQFALTGGIGNTVGEATNMALRKAMRNFGEKAAGKFIAKSASGLAKGAVMTALQPATYANIASKLTELNPETGKLKYGTGAAITSGLLDSYIETLSEMAGGSVEELRKSGALNFLEDLSKNSRLLRALTRSQATKLHKALHAAGFNGLIGEMGEEWYGNGLRVLLDQMSTDEFKQFASPEEQLTMLASFAPMSLLGAATKISGFRNSRNADAVANNQNIKDITDANIPEPSDNTQASSQEVPQEESQQPSYENSESIEDIARRFNETNKGLDLSNITSLTPFRNRETNGLEGYVIGKTGKLSTVAINNGNEWRIVYYDNGSFDRQYVEDNSISKDEFYRQWDAKQKTLAEQNAAEEAEDESVLIDAGADAVDSDIEQKQEDIVQDAGEGAKEQISQDIKDDLSDEDFISSLPVIKKGSFSGQVDMGSLTPADSYRYVRIQLGEDEAREYILGKIEEIRSDIAKIDNDISKANANDKIQYKLKKRAIESTLAEYTSVLGEQAANTEQPDVTEQPIEEKQQPVNAEQGVDAGQNVGGETAGQTTVETVDMQEPVVTQEVNADEVSLSTEQQVLDAIKSISSDITKQKTRLTKVTNGTIKGNESEERQKLDKLTSELSMLKDELAKYRVRQEGEKTFNSKENDRKASAIKKEANEKFSGIAERYANGQKKYGNNGVITLANGDVVRGRYVIVDAGAITASHDPIHNFSRSEGFPVNENGETVNDRDYEKDRRAQESVMEKARAYDGRALSPTPPVVSSDGVVVSGNDRTMSGQLAANKGTDSKYVEHISDPAVSGMYGFTTRDIAEFAHPRIIFEADGDFEYTTKNFAKFNSEYGKSQDKTEVAVKTGKIISEEALARIAAEINGFDGIGEVYQNEDAVDNIIKILISDGLLQQNDVARLKDGRSLSGYGQDVIESNLVGAVLNQEAARDVMSDRAIRRSIVSAISQIVEAGALSQEFSLSQEISDAVKLLYDAKSEKDGITLGEDVGGYVRQYNLYGDDVVAESTVQLLANCMNSKASNDLKKALTLYNSEAGLADSGQGDIFTVNTKESLLKEVLERYGYNTDTVDTSSRAEQRERGRGEEDEAGPSLEGSEAGGEREERQVAQQDADLTGTLFGESANGGEAVVSSETQEAEAEQPEDTDTDIEDGDVREFVKGIVKSTKEAYKKNGSEKTSALSQVTAVINNMATSRDIDALISEAEKALRNDKISDNSRYAYNYIKNVAKASLLTKNKEGENKQQQKQTPKSNVAQSAKQETVEPTKGGARSAKRKTKEEKDDAAYVAFQKNSRRENPLDDVAFYDDKIAKINAEGGIQSDEQYEELWDDYLYLRDRKNDSDTSFKDVYGGRTRDITDEPSASVYGDVYSKISMALTKYEDRTKRKPSGILTGSRLEEYNRKKAEKSAKKKSGDNGSTKDTKEDAAIRKAEESARKQSLLHGIFDNEDRIKTIESQLNASYRYGSTGKKLSKIIEAIEKDISKLENYLSSAKDGEVKIDGDVLTVADVQSLINDRKKELDKYVDQKNSLEEQLADAKELAEKARSEYKELFKDEPKRSMLSFRFDVAEAVVDEPATKERQSATYEQILAITERLRKILPPDVRKKVRVLSSNDFARQRRRDGLLTADGKVMGYVNIETGDVVINAGNHSFKTTIHEIGIHSVAKIARDNGYEKLHNAIQEYGRNADKQFKDYVKQAYGYEEGEERFNEEVAAHAFAEFAMNRQIEYANRSAFEKLVDAIRDAFNYLFGGRYADLSVFDAVAEKGNEAIGNALYNLAMGGKQIGVKGAEERRLSEKMDAQMSNMASDEYDNTMSVLMSSDENERTASEWIKFFRKNGVNSEYLFDELERRIPTAMISSAQVSQIIYDIYEGSVTPIYEQLAHSMDEDISSTKRILNTAITKAKDIVFGYILMRSRVEEEGGYVPEDDFNTLHKTAPARAKYKFEQFEQTYVKPIEESVLTISKKLGDRRIDFSEYVYSAFGLKYGVNDVGGPDAVDRYLIALHTPERIKYIVCRKVVDALKDTTVAVDNKVVPINASIEDVAALYDGIIFGSIDISGIEDPSFMPVINELMKYKDETQRLFAGTMTERQAQDYVKNFESIVGADLCEELRRRVENATTNILMESVNYGLISKSEMEEYRGRWEHYVPLRDFDDDIDKEFATALADLRNPSGAENGSVVSNVEVDRLASGRSSLSASPTAGIIFLADNTFRNGEENISRLSLLDMITHNEKLNGMFCAVRRGMRSSSRGAIKEYDSDGNAVYSYVPRWASNMSKDEYSDHSILVWQNGNPVEMVFSGEVGKTFAMANERTRTLLSKLKSEGRDVVYKAINMQGKITRFRSRLMTTLNPVFVLLTNPMADIKGALYTAPIRGGYMVGARMLKNIIPSLVSNGAALFGSKTELYRRYEAAGGPISYYKYLTIDNIKEDVERTRKRISEGKKADTKNALSWWYALGEKIENVSRYAAFKAGVESGLTDAQAAVLARDCATDLARRGRSDFADIATSFFPFFNATLESSYQALEVGFNKKMRNRAAVLIPVYASLAFLSSIMNRALAAYLTTKPDGDDEDDAYVDEVMEKTRSGVSEPVDEGDVLGHFNPYNTAPDYKKKTEVIIPWSVNEYGQLDFITIRNGFKYRVLDYAADKLVQYMLVGDISLDDTLSAILSAIADEYNPLGQMPSSDSKSDSDGAKSVVYFMTSLMPPEVSGGIRTLANMNNFGSVLHNTPSDETGILPKYMIAKDNTPELNVAISKWLSDISGGMSVKEKNELISLKGRMEVYPETIQMWLENNLGWLYKAAEYGADKYVLRNDAEQQSVVPKNIIDKALYYDASEYDTMMNGRVIELKNYLKSIDGVSSLGKDMDVELDKDIRAAIIEAGTDEISALKKLVRASDGLRKDYNLARQISYSDNVSESEKERAQEGMVKIQQAIKTLNYLAEREMYKLKHQGDNEEN